jgi:hypothetical protein
MDAWLIFYVNNISYHRCLQARSRALQLVDAPNFSSGLTACRTD